MVTIEELAAAVPGGFVFGERDHKVKRIVDFTSLKSDHDLLFLSSDQVAEHLAKIEGVTPCAIVEKTLWERAKDSLATKLKAAIISPRPKFALARVSNYLPRRPSSPASIHPAAHVSPTAQIGNDCTVHAGAVIEDNVKIGARSVIHPNVTIGEGTTLGESCRIHPGVTIADGVTIGDRVIIQPNAVIGGDGFSFETEQLNHAEQAKLGDSATARKAQPWERIESFGSVEIGDDVEIGSGSAIDRATFGKTVIGRGTKIDNLVQIGHNCRIGEDTLLCAQVGVAGSSKIGSGCILAGKVGVADHLTIGDHSAIMAKSGVTKNLDGGKVYYGMPARPVKETLRNYTLITKLGDMRQRLSELEKAFKDIATNT